mgnify:CR=1 FL=1
MAKMIAVWGSNGSGKKTLSLAIAAQLAHLNKNSVIISTDSSTPALPVFLPNKQITSDGSIGELLSRPISGIGALKGYIHLHPASERIGFMGIASGESPLSYRAFKREIMTSLLRILNDSPFDYGILCCQSNPVMDTMTQLALSTADYPIRMITPDVRGIEFEKSQKGWLRGIPEMRIDSQIRIISPVLRFSPLNRILEITGSSDYFLPFSKDISDKAASGQLVCGCRERYGIQYDKQVKKLAGYMVSQSEGK